MIRAPGEGDAEGVAVNSARASTPLDEIAATTMSDI